MGSGSNYMAYHISNALALKFFLRDTSHPVLNFLFFDQSRFDSIHKVFRRGDDKED
ncbi:hypothetical protein CXF68_14220 [Tenacibaculum sp. Bg11-29]|nr:hypothetical protein CXF68_14220 [Tenacibaculum sp. Bg11-29]